MYFAYVAETDCDAYAVKLLADSKPTADKRLKAIHFPGKLVKMHEIGSCKLDQDEGEKLYEKACKKAYALATKLKPVAGCNKSTGRMF